MMLPGIKNPFLHSENNLLVVILILLLCLGNGLGDPWKKKIKLALRTHLADMDMVA